MQKTLVCARCQTATYWSKDCQVYTTHRKRVGHAINAVIDYSNTHINANANVRACARTRAHTHK